MTAHVHAENMMLYAQDAAETDRPWERWQVQASHGGWLSYTESAPDWNPADKYRRKPRTHIVNGFEVPEPMRKAPPLGTTYWVVHPVVEALAEVTNWNGIEPDRRWLERGIAHATKEAAVANAKAMIGVQP